MTAYARLGGKREARCFVRDCGALLGWVDESAHYVLPYGWHVVDGVAEQTARMRHLVRGGHVPDPMRRMVGETLADRTARHHWRPRTRTNPLPLEAICPRCGRLQTIDAGPMATTT